MVTWGKLQVRRIWLESYESLLRYWDVWIRLQVYRSVLSPGQSYTKRKWLKHFFYYLQNYRKYSVSQWNNHQCKLFPTWKCTGTVIALIDQNFCTSQKSLFFIHTALLYIIRKYTVPLLLFFFFLFSVSFF